MKQNVWSKMWLLILLLGLAGARLAAGETVVIVNEKSAVTSVDEATLKSLLLGQKKKWDDGTQVVLACPKEGEAADAFLKDLLGKSNKQFLTYWKKMVFTGKGAMPKLFDSDAELVQYVRLTAGAIGMIPADTPHDGVKTLTVSP